MAMTLTLMTSTCSEAAMKLNVPMKGAPAALRVGVPVVRKLSQSPAAVRLERKPAAKEGSNDGRA